MFEKKVGSKEEKMYGYYKSKFDEIFRQLRTNLEYLSIDKNLQVVNVSTRPKEGKSTVAGNLAKVSMAKYSNVLLIDRDLCRPVIRQMFQVSNCKGLSDLLLHYNQFDLYDEIFFHRSKGTKNEGALYILTSDTKALNLQKMLSGDKFKQLIKKLKEWFESIVIDCPPVLSVADAIHVSNITDGTLFIISFKKTNKQEALLAVTQLQRNGAHILGTALTKVENDKAEQYYYCYNKQELV